MNPAPTIAQAFTASMRAHPERPALICAGQRFTHGQLNDLAERLARGLHRWGVVAGDRVVIFMPHCPQWLVAWLAVQHLGAVCVPVSHFYGPDDLEYIVEDCGARIIVCMDSNVDCVAQVKPEAGLRRAVVASLSDVLDPGGVRPGGLGAGGLDPGGADAGSADPAAPGGRAAAAHSHAFLEISPFSDLLVDGDEPLPALSIDPAETAELLYTGGTTGIPKGVPFSNLNFLESLAAQRSLSEAGIPRGSDVVLQGAALNHILGQTVGLGALLAGDCLVLLSKMDLEAILTSIHEHRVTTFFGTPTLYRMLLAHERLSQYDLRSLVFCMAGGEHLPDEVVLRWEQATGCTIWEGYGATETCGGIANTPIQGQRRSGSAGPIVPIRQVLLVDPETLEPTPSGSPGELLVASAHMVRAYWNKPEETTLHFVEIAGQLWYRTGDIVRLDEDGWLYFVDRSCDVIKHKGYRVSASKVDVCLSGHPAVDECCSIGVADSAVGERVKSFVVRGRGAEGIAEGIAQRSAEGMAEGSAEGMAEGSAEGEPTAEALLAEELVAWCRERLASYEVPAVIEFREELPKSKVGKLLRRELRDEERARAVDRTDDRAPGGEAGRRR